METNKPVELKEFYNIPDNYIDLYEYRYSCDFNQESEDFLSVVDSAKKENDAQKYIKNNNKWFIPGSIFRNYDFGNHCAFIVPEQKLGAEYIADYMLLGKNSIGFQIILVEFEDVNVKYKISTSNTESGPVRKGLTQIKDWKRWMDSNREYFLKSCGLEHLKENIPSWGIHYCLVVSRRKLMDDASNAMRGQTQHETPGLTIITYDRLVDKIKLLGNGF